MFCCISCLQVCFEYWFPLLFAGQPAAVQAKAKAKNKVAKDKKDQGLLVKVEQQKTVEEQVAVIRQELILATCSASVHLCCLGGELKKEITAINNILLDFTQLPDNPDCVDFKKFAGCMKTQVQILTKLFNQPAA